GSARKFSAPAPIPSVPDGRGAGFYRRPEVVSGIRHSAEPITREDALLAYARKVSGVGDIVAGGIDSRSRPIIVTGAGRSATSWLTSVCKIEAMFFFTKKCSVHFRLWRRSSGESIKRPIAPASG